MELFNTIFYFLIVIGILVFVHEFGHFAAARLMGMRAEVFALGIGYRLFGWNKVTGFSFGKMRENVEMGDHTDYRICAFPIGGYVKVAGMVDESMDKNFIDEPAKPWEFRSKPVWKRMVVITAGVIMNILLAFFIFYALTLIKGKNLTETTTVGYVSLNTPAYTAGIQPGDKILSINNTPVSYWEDVTSSIYIDNLGETLTLAINRNGKDTVIRISKEQIGDLTEKNIGIFPEKVMPLVNMVVAGKPAETAGLGINDVITEFNGVKINNSQQLIELIKANANRTSEIKWMRNGQQMSGMVTPGIDSTIGIGISAKYEGPVKIEEYNVINAIPKAASDMYYYGVEVFFSSIYKIIKGDIPFNKAIGGPVKIAQVSAQSAEGGLFTFLSFLALLSMSLAVINILPFPALDGGHFVMLAYEGIVRRPVPYKVQIVLQNVGFALLLVLMLFVIYNDIISL